MTVPFEIVVDTPARLAAVFCDRLTQAALAAVAARGRFTMALPGGSVAETFFPPLTRAALDWTRVHVVWGDERAVPPEDSESNFGVARRRLLDHVPIPSGNVHRMPADGPDMDAAAAAYARDLAGILGTPPTLDITLLGVGPEGHVCSLFPGHAALAERHAWVVAVRDSPKPPPRRLTLTLPALATSDLVCVAAFGAVKAEALREAIESPGSALPVAQAARSGRRALFLLDPAAASQLRTPV